ncbi:hypothetical protein [Pseudomonas sp. PSKL.D1]|uniref:hypothetical protein n=1 Tax=Pseudomonas sp. PSKL.D1 TaxID=3029060 RepID=UPI002380E2DF|nr:hypothetical protein [Pseudomonas sp. PSKL.D1]WDY56914.1 hypothetical protein PVV54_20380 [Pseudomonas sp. PSKL.D1]
MDRPIHMPRRRQVEPQRSYELAAAENPMNIATSSRGRSKRAIANTGRFWRPGRTLMVSFYGNPDKALKSKVFKTALQWTEGSRADLGLQLAPDNDTTAQIRVLLDLNAPGSESDIGTDAMAFNDESMTLNVSANHPLFDYTVLHEFGHAFGIEHEHQHPGTTISWNEQTLLADNAPFGWTAQDIVDQYTKKRTDGLIKVDYDPRSIMHYPVLRRWTLNDIEVGQNHTLSEGDLERMRLAYPYN